MIATQDFEHRVADALAAVRDRVAVRLAAAVPPDVAVATTADGVVVSGVALAWRALADPRLRDLAGLVR